jgi:hypothetical protein
MTAKTESKPRVCIPVDEAVEYAAQVRSAALMMARYNNDKLALTVEGLVRLARTLEGRR